MYSPLRDTFTFILFLFPTSMFSNPAFLSLHTLFQIKLPSWLRLNTSLFSSAFYYPTHNKSSFAREQMCKLFVKQKQKLSLELSPVKCPVALKGLVHLEDSWCCWETFVLQ